MSCGRHAVLAAWHSGVVSVLQRCSLPADPADGRRVLPPRVLGQGRAIRRLHIGMIPRCDVVGDVAWRYCSPASAAGFMMTTFGCFAILPAASRAAAFVSVAAGCTPSSGSATRRGTPCPGLLRWPPRRGSRGAASPDRSERSLNRPVLKHSLTAFRLSLELDQLVRHLVVDLDRADSSRCSRAGSCRRPGRRTRRSGCPASPATGPPCGSVQSGALPAGAPRVEDADGLADDLAGVVEEEGVRAKCTALELGQRQMRKTASGRPPRRGSPARRGRRSGSAAKRPAPRSTPWRQPVWKSTSFEAVALEIFASTSMPSLRRLSWRGEAVSHRSTEPARPRHRAGVASISVDPTAAQILQRIKAISTQAPAMPLYTVSVSSCQL